LLELQCLQIRDIETHHNRLSVAKPTTRRGARHAEIRGDGHVPGALDEIPKPVIVARLTAAVLVMGMIIGRSLKPLKCSTLRAVRRRRMVR